VRVRVRARIRVWVGVGVGVGVRVWVRAETLKQKIGNRIPTVEHQATRRRLARALEFGGRVSNIEHRTLKLEARNFKEAARRPQGGCKEAASRKNQKVHKEAARRLQGGCKEAAGKQGGLRSVAILAHAS